MIARAKIILHHLINSLCVCLLSNPRSFLFFCFICFLSSLSSLARLIRERTIGGRSCFISGACLHVSFKAVRYLTARPPADRFAANYSAFCKCFITHCEHFLTGNRKEEISSCLLFLLVFFLMGALDKKKSFQGLQIPRVTKCSEVEE